MKKCKKQSTMNQSTFPLLSPFLLTYDFKYGPVNGLFMNEGSTSHHLSLYACSKNWYCSILFYRLFEIGFTSQ